MRHHLALLATCIISCHSSAQSISSTTYNFKKTRVNGEKVFRLTSPDHQLDAWKRYKRPDGYYFLRFTYDQKKYYWKYQHNAIMTLYQGDSVVADVLSALRIGGVEYYAASPTWKTWVCYRDGTEVFRVIRVKENGRVVIRSEVLEDQGDRQEVINAIGAFKGTKMIADGRDKVWAPIIGIPVGVGLGLLLKPED